MADYEPIFTSAHEALVFAFSFRWEQYPETPMSKMMKRAGGHLGSGRGLAGLDGAAQAGMVRCELGRLPKEQCAALVARYGGKPSDCPVCAGPKRTEEWQLATECLAALVSTVIDGDLRTRRALVRRHYGERATLSDLSDALGVPRSTLGDHSSKVAAALKALEARSLRAVERALCDCGMVDIAAVAA